MTFLAHRLAKANGHDEAAAIRGGDVLPSSDAELRHARAALAKATRSSGTRQPDRRPPGARPLPRNVPIGPQWWKAVRATSAGEADSPRRGGAADAFAGRVRAVGRRRCRPGDLPYWLDDELWRIELDEPVREARYQLASPRARLVARIAGWEPALGREYAQACALHARDLALAHLAPSLRDALAGVDDLAAIAAAVRGAVPQSRAAEYVSDAAHNALHVGPATTSYIACMLASTLGGGLAAFEAERAWQAGWLAERLGLEREE